MTRPWETIDRVDTADGPLELRRRGPGDFLITVSGRVLMNSRASRSEEALARYACESLTEYASPSVVIGGLGMGCTLRAALDVLPESARVVVCELNETVATWCRGPLAEVSDAALSDARVALVIGDVTAHIRNLAEGRLSPRADSILLDLYEGPHRGTDPHGDPLYGHGALARTRRALAPGGAFAIWSEGPDAGFEKRLRGAGFADITRRRPGRGGRRHAVYVARTPKWPGASSRGRRTAR